MTGLFSRILNMSMTGSIVILLVILVRFFLRKLPKLYAYLLWSVVLFRLLCPVSIAAPLSVLNTVSPEITNVSDIVSVVSYIPEALPLSGGNHAEPSGIPMESNAQIVRENNTSVPTLLTAASWIWCVGMGILAIYNMLQYFRVKSRIVGAVRYRQNIYLADHIETAFVLGILRPRIYLPSNIPPQDRKYIIAHERHHIFRGDHIIKLLSFSALCIHWFNPFVWAAFLLSSKDMEMSCDEAVIRKYGSDARADYSQTLLTLTSHRKIIPGMPLAFGEGDTKGRVRNISRWRKPKTATCIIAILLCIAVLAACGVNPVHSISLMDRVFVTMPDEYTIEQESVSNHLFVHGKTVVGGIKGYSIPEGFEPNQYLSEDFLIAMGITELSDDGIGFYMESGGSGSDGSIEFFSDVPPGQERTVHQYHQFYVTEDDCVIDIWFDLLVTDQAIREKILRSVEIPELEITKQQYQETIPQNTVSYLYEIKELPDGYFFDTLGPTSTLFTDGINVYGGIDIFTIPEGVYDPTDTAWFWLEKMGLPDFENPDLCYIGGMTSGDYGWLAEFASDVPEGTPKTVHKRHGYYVVGDQLIDIWLDMMLLDYQEAAVIERAISIQRPESAQSTLTSYEDLAFGITAKIMEAVSNNSCHIVSVQKNDGNEGPKGYEKNFLYHEGNYLYTSQVLTEGENLTEAGEYYNRYGLLIVEDAFYSNAGFQGNPETIVWEETEPVDPEVPWLGNRVWNKSFATYIDTLKDENGVCYMFRYDKPYEDRDDYSDHYFVNFYFTPQAEFHHVTLQVNMFQENAFTVTETIQSMDENHIANIIETEYRAAIS